jgi:hypothetical protein
LIVAIHQPVYLPWLGFFHKMYSCDCFVLLDDAAFSKNSVENRNLIKTPNGTLWLTVPVRTKGRLGQLIRDVEIDNSKEWQQKHWKTIMMNYRKATFFQDFGQIFEETYSRRWDRLVELNQQIIFDLARTFGIDRKVVLSSSLSASGQSTLRLVNICKALAADTYFSGIGAKAYQDETLFASEGIRVVYQQYTPTAYSQLYGKFVPNLSAIDYLFNCGAANPFGKEGRVEA